MESVWFLAWSGRVHWACMVDLELHWRTIMPGGGVSIKISSAFLWSL